VMGDDGTHFACKSLGRVGGVNTFHVSIMHWTCCLIILACDHVSEAVLIARLLLCWLWCRRSLKCQSLSRLRVI